MNASIFELMRKQEEEKKDKDITHALESALAKINGLRILMNDRIECLKEENEELRNENKALREKLTIINKNPRNGVNIIKVNNVQKSEEEPLCLHGIIRKEFCTPTEIRAPYMNMMCVKNDEKKSDEAKIIDILKKLTQQVEKK